MTPLQKAAKIRNWKILQIKGAIAVLQQVNKLFITEPMLQMKNRVRLKGMEKALIKGVDASYQLFKYEYIQEKQGNDRP